MTLDPVALLIRMLEIPSVSMHEAELAHFLAAEMARLGFESFVDEAGNAIGIIGAGPDVALLGHIDTVPGEIPVRIENGNLYGRGAVDAKGPFAAFICAAARLAASKERLPFRLVLIGAVEEEAASSKGARYAAERYHPIACVIGEPSGWDRITLGYKGRLLVDGVWEQPMSHSAGREASVAERAVAFWNEVAAHCEAHNQGRERLFDQLLPSLRSICTRSDGLTDRAELTIGVRLPPDIPPETLASTLAEHSHGGVLRFRDLCPAYQAEKNTPLARAFLRGIRAAGGTPGFLLKTGTSDMNIVGPVWRCPILAYGPGDSSLDHAPNEHIVIEEYLRAIEVLEHALRHLGSIPFK
ncbi:MAG: [LysW]-lysine hydrolase [Roseiflexus sp.]|nr:[LysW]-lysine hydrolase [Roseiflexus sp.]MCS7291036.1 [LysW]-lysine hydrolase [Roseiflexus sp.]MDW8146776.1 [LysW]-lysine hydrolase [Roseiflexaceae bacterium]